MRRETEESAGGRSATNAKKNSEMCVHALGKWLQAAKAIGDRPRVLPWHPLFLVTPAPGVAVQNLVGCSVVADDNPHVAANCPRDLVLFHEAETDGPEQGDSFFDIALNVAFESAEIGTVLHARLLVYFGLHLRETSVRIGAGNYDFRRELSALCRPVIVVE